VVEVSKIDEFKVFVRTKPELISYVKNGDMTWQKFYELWDLYGANHDTWTKYSKVDEAKSATKAAETFGLTELFNMFKKVDMKSIQNNITGIQKAITLIQEMGIKGGSDRESTNDTYKPRPIYRRFED
jgi:hypothetical protein